MNDNASLAEEKSFLKNYTVPFVQLDPLKVILVFSHDHNTFDKKKLLNNQDEKYCKPSSRNVDEFVKESELKDFYMNKIEDLLKTYEPGLPYNKPDVLKQLEELEKERSQQHNSKIILNQNGNNIELNNEQIVHILKQQQEQLQTQQEQLQTQQEQIQKQQKELEIKNRLLETLIRKNKELELQLNNDNNLLIK